MIQSADQPVEALRREAQAILDEVVASVANNA
jgi:hypothetical protein